MAYEVTKLVNGRPYRYRVRSERDPASGSSRNRWTYLGRADAGATAPRRAVRPNAREALLDAFERLLDRSEIDRVTAGAVSAEAGLAHGTFYRYFRNKDDAIRALAARWRGELVARARRARDRAGLARRSPRGAAALDRADACAPSPTTAAWFAPGTIWPLAIRPSPSSGARAATLTSRCSRTTSRCWSNAAIRTVAPDATARTLSAMLDGFHRRALGEDQHDESHIRAALDFVERGVFGVLPDDVTPSAASVPEG